MTARVKFVPEAIDVIGPGACSPVTWTGTADWVVVPLPSWPLLLYPQHQAAPASVRAQVLEADRDRAVMVFPAMAGTATGMFLLEVEPLPRAP